MYELGTAAPLAVALLRGTYVTDSQVKRKGVAGQVGPYDQGKVRLHADAD